MSRVDIYSQDRGERLKYTSTPNDVLVTLPITKDGFEALLEEAAKCYDLPVDDMMRQVLAGYVHHIANEENTTTVQKIAVMLYKSVSNSLTWQIDQEIKLKAREEAEQKAKELAKESPSMETH